MISISQIIGHYQQTIKNKKNSHNNCLLDFSKEIKKKTGTNKVRFILGVKQNKLMYIMVEIYYYIHMNWQDNLLEMPHKK